MKKISFLLSLACTTICIPNHTLAALPEEAENSGIEQSTAFGTELDDETRAVVSGNFAAALTTRVDDDLWVGRVRAANNATNVSATSVSRNAGTGNWEIAYKDKAGTGIADTTINNVGGQQNTLGQITTKQLITGADTTGTARAIAVGGTPTFCYMSKGQKNILVNAEANNLANKLKFVDFRGGLNTATGLYALAATHQPVKYANNLAAAENIIFAFVGDNIAFEASTNDKRAINIVPVKEKNLSLAKAAELTTQGTGVVPLQIHFGDETLTGDSVNGAGIIAPPTPPGMWWDDKLNRLYLATGGIKTPAANTDRASGLVMAVINPAVAGLGTGSIELQAVTNLDQTAVRDTVNGVFSAKSTGANANQRKNIFISKPCTIHTSTGKDYLLVVGGVVDGDKPAGSDEALALATWLNALPLIPANTTVPDNQGKIAKTGGNGQPTDWTSIPGNTLDDVVLLNRSYTSKSFDPVSVNLFRLYEIPVVVGNDPRWISQDTSQPFSDIQVVGDTVYVAATSGRDANNKKNAGIFASTAIFAETGNVRAWTPWQRVGGNDQTKIAGFGVSNKTQKAVYMKGDGNFNANTSLWYAGDSDRHTAGNTLNDALTSLQKTGGVYGLFSFDGKTPGFSLASDVHANAAKQPDAFELMVATGNGQVALIQTGAIDNPGVTNIFKATSAYTTADFTAAPNPTKGAVYIYSKDTPNNRGADLANLGPITCAEVMRKAPVLANVNHGLIFVGGQGGIAYLRRITAANVATGWLNLTGLANINKDWANATTFPIGEDYAWKQLTKQDGTNPFTNVRKIIADGTYLYVLTNNALCRIEVDTASLGAVATRDKIIDTKFKIIASISTVGGLPGFKDDTLGAPKQLLDPDSGDQFIDMVPVKLDTTLNGAFKFAVATTKGLFINQTAMLTDASNANALGWANKVDTAGNALTLGPILRMDFINAERGGWKTAAAAATATLNGNLYVTALTAQGSSDVAVYRFDVNAGSVKAIKEPYFDGLAATPANRTNYFYKVGPLSDDLANKAEFAGPLDLVASSATVGHNNSDFFSILPMPVNPDKFLDAGKDKSAIDLKQQISSYSQLAQPVLDHASGAQYLPIANLNGDNSVAVIVNE